MAKQGAIGGTVEIVEGARGSNQSGMRAHNERLVLTLIRQIGPLAKVELARLTGLSAQTVSVIMRSLEADGLLEKGEPQRGKVGQPSVPMCLRAEGAYFLGLKVGRRSLDLILIDFLGSIRGHVHRTHRYPAPDNVVDFANTSIAELLDQLTPDQRARVAGLGIAIPFQLWGWAKPLGVDDAEMEDWRHRDISTEIAKNWAFPVFLQNDASAACGAELVFGDQAKPRDFLYFFVGFFVGGGLVLDNALHTGRTGNAAALGSIPIGIEGTRVRQLVEVASLIALERMLVAAGGKGHTIWESSTSWSVPDDILNAWIEQAAEGLAYAIISASCVVDVECAVIDGWLPNPVRAALVAGTARRLKALHVAGIDLPEVREGTTGSDARSLGAASLPLAYRFMVDRNAFAKGER